jgi:hypothetical protein
MWRKGWCLAYHIGTSSRNILIKYHILERLGDIDDKCGVWLVSSLSHRHIVYIILEIYNIDWQSSVSPLSILYIRRLRDLGLQDIGLQDFRTSRFQDFEIYRL